MVVFLDDSLATADDAEAQQLGAVAALYALAGDRNYDMLLPQPYRHVWKQVGEARSKRQADVASRAAAQAERQQRDKQRAAKQALRGPQVGACCCRSI